MSVVELKNIKVKECGNGYYLRWYSDGWHHWLFKGGFETFNTKGEVYSSHGYSSLSIGDIVKVSELAAIRGILKANFIEIYTNDGWKPATLDSESWQLGKADRLSVQINFTITTWLKGAAEVVSIDYVTDPPFNFLTITITEGGGTYSLSPEKDSYSIGDTVQITAIPIIYETYFYRYIVNGVSYYENPISIVIEGETSVFIEMRGIV